MHLGQRAAFLWVAIEYAADAAQTGFCNGPREGAPHITAAQNTDLNNFCHCLFLPASYLSNARANSRKACTSSKLVTSPTEIRTAPVDLPSMHTRKSSIDRRCWCKGCEKHTASSRREIPKA